MRQQRASELLKKLWEDGAGRLSTQVLQEFYVNVTQKIRAPLASGTAREVVRNYGSIRNRRNLADLVLGQHDYRSRGTRWRR